MKELDNELIIIVRVEFIEQIQTIAVCTNEPLRTTDQIIEGEYVPLDDYAIMPIRMIAYRVLLFLPV